MPLLLPSASWPAQRFMTRSFHQALRSKLFEASSDVLSSWHYSKLPKVRTTLYSRAPTLCFSSKRLSCKSQAKRPTTTLSSGFCMDLEPGSHQHLKHHSGSGQFSSSSKASRRKRRTWNQGSALWPLTQPCSLEQQSKELRPERLRHTDDSGDNKTLAPLMSIDYHDHLFVGSVYQALDGKCREPTKSMVLSPCEVGVWQAGG